MMKPSLQGTSIKKNFDILIDSLFYSLLIFHDFQCSTYISSLMHLVLVIKKSFNMYTRVQDERKTYRNTSMKNSLSACFDS